MPRRRRSLHSLPVLVAAGMVGTLCLGSPRVPAPRHQSSPAVYPTPQSIIAHGGPIRVGQGVALVVGSGSDPSAVSTTRNALHSVGVTNIGQVTSVDGAPPHDSVIVVGGTAGRSAAKDLVDEDAGSLPSEGYVLATGREHGRAIVALDGHDATGTYYAAQTLRQLLTGRGQQARVAGIVVRDWPAMPIRGVIEGFYGTPWSHKARLNQLNFYGAHKMNTYVYSPKDDPYLRAQWRDPYPAAKLAQLKQLVTRARRDHIQFTYALSPGLSVCYSSAGDEKALIAKFQSLWDIGVRSFVIPLDDISYTKWNCAADEAKFGTGGGAAGAAQSYLLNAVQKDFIATHPGAAPLQMVPTEYYNVSASPYKAAISSDLDPSVVVQWTGVGVIPATITKSEAAAAKKAYGHSILLWDNYPVNDYATDRLLLGPYVGRDPGLGDWLIGITANPMIEPEVSKLALFTAADYTWNDTAYDAQKSWEAAITELAGDDPKARSALAAFADLEHYSKVDPTQAPVLAAKIADFWKEWKSGTRGPKAFDSYLSVIQHLPTTLRVHLHDPAFVADAKPWLDSAGQWGTAARAAVTMLQDQRAGRGSAAMAERTKVNRAVAKAKSYTYVGIDGSSEPVLVGDGVIDTFVNQALAENDAWRERTTPSNL